MATDLQTRLSSAFARSIERRPGRSLVVLLTLVAIAGVLASQLGINTNQLELLDQDLRAVKDIKRVVDMVGGAGHFLIALRGRDEQQLKRAVEDIAAILEADDEHIRYIHYKLPIEFVRQRAPLYLETEDLEEVRRRGFAFLDDRLKRADPFFFEIRVTEPVKLDIEPIIAKYRKVGKKSITDDYFISDDKEMILISTKPMWNSTQLGKTGELVKLLDAKFAEYSADNPHGIKLVQDYSSDPDPDPNVIEYGYSGSYKLTYDESFEIKNSLIPVGGVAFVGVVFVMLLFFRSRVGALVLVITGLLAGIVLSFGFAKIAIGELNMITSILAGILMGVGIDFGIHVVYRLREELSKHETVGEAVLEAVTHQAPASFVSAAGIGAAFFSLSFSDFNGFSQFGILAGAGVFITGVCIYTWIPALLTLGESRWPGLSQTLIGLPPKAPSAGPIRTRIPRPKLILAVSLTFALGMLALAPGVEFDYSTRTLMVEDQASIKLLEEMSVRFEVLADPLRIFSKDLETTLEIHEEFKNNKEKYPMVDQAYSVFTFVPPMDQQLRNRKIMDEIQAKLGQIDPSVLPPEYQDSWKAGMTMLEAQPFGVEDLPPSIRNTFHSLPSAKPENQGWLVSVYPSANLWDGKRVMAFAAQTETIELPSGKVVHAAGLPILYAKLAHIVLSDAKVTSVMTSVLLLIILLIDFRSITYAMVALIPLLLGVGIMLGSMRLMGITLNFMNIIVFPIVLGYGVSHGVYLMHRFREGSSPMEALRSVGTAVACSTFTTLAGWAALLFAAHRGLRTIGVAACIGMLSTLIVSFTVMPALLQLMHDRRVRRAKQEAPSDHEASPG